MLSNALSGNPGLEYLKLRKNAKQVDDKGYFFGWI
jgi:hypothetical protein